MIQAGARLLQICNETWLQWAQEQVTAHHYRHTPVDARSKPLAYLIARGARHECIPVGCLIFGRPESTRCYDGDPTKQSFAESGLTYGSPEDIKLGKARYSRWEIINLARVWLDPSVQRGGEHYMPNLATWAIGEALKRVVVDYLKMAPPCFLDEPWKLRVCLSYCDTNTHTGALYWAAGFQKVRTNAKGKQTWVRKLRGLQGHERKEIERLAQQSLRSRAYRSERAAGAIEQTSLNFERS